MGLDGTKTSGTGARRGRLIRPGRGWARRPDFRPGLSARTLALIRWIAAAGQLTAVLVVELELQYHLALDKCLIIIGLLVLSNLWLTFWPDWRGRISGNVAAAFMAFDILEVTALSFFTGGLNNPFTLLVIAPVTVSASALSRGHTVGLSVLTLVCITFLAFFHYPLPWVREFGLVLPLNYLLAVWTALAVAVAFIASYVWSVVEESRRVADALTASEAALAREQQMSALGGLAAAAAHELGSPLATIAIVAKELKDHVPPGSPAMEDVELLISQTRRCRDILTGLARAPEAAGGAAAVVEAPLIGLLQEAAENHMPEAIQLDMRVDEASSGPEPLVPRSPEILQGLGNLIQNAGQFAASRVDLALGWDEERIWIRISDDGPGFPAWMLANLGEPYLSTRAGDGEHLGLGVFIASTLLQRTGAHISFQNRKGAEVVLEWDRARLESGGRPFRDTELQEQGRIRQP